MKASYEWLQTFFAKGELPDVHALHDKLVFYAYEVEEIENPDTTNPIFDIDVLPNRSSDSLSQRGIAREISTLFNIPMAHDPLTGSVALEPITSEVRVEIDPDSSCMYYTAALIKGVSVGPSPEWLVKCLESVGQRSINNIVDATNYILFELGQPLHAFDADKMSGNILVRNAKEGEHIELLGAEPRELSASMSIIADAVSGDALAVAGVKGGTKAEVDSNTTNVILEAANFDPTKTRKTAQALRIRTDASTRYENEVPAPLTPIAMQALTELVLKIAGGELVGYAAVGDATRISPTVSLSLTHINKCLGATLTAEDVVGIFKRLDCAVEHESEHFTVTAPWYRTDLTIPEEFIEEVGRISGYEHLEATPLPPMATIPTVLPSHAAAQIIRTTLVALGYTEVYLYALRATGTVALANALASDKDHLRENLTDGIAESLNKNEPYMPLLGISDTLRIFEIGHVFSEVSEDINVCLGVRVSGNKKREERTHHELTTAKEALEQVLGVPLPEPSGETLEFSLSALLDSISIPSGYSYVGAPAHGVQYKPFSMYPFVLRDIAVWVPEGTDECVVTDVITKHGGELVQRIDKFDEFTKDGRVSLAFHIVFQSMEKTLTDDEIGGIMAAITADLAAAGYEVR